VKTTPIVLTHWQRTPEEDLKAPVMLSPSLRSRVNCANHLDAPVMLSNAKHLGIEQKVSLNTGPQIAGRFQFASQILRLRLRMTRAESYRRITTVINQLQEL